MTRVIVAEDNLEMLEAVADAIEATGARVTRVQSGAELLASLARASFDLIVTDVSMPWMGGLQVAASVRGARIRTPIIVMTASLHSGLQGRVEALGGRTLLLRKPFDMVELQTAVFNLIA